MKKRVLLNLHKKYIKGTGSKIAVENKTILLCHLTKAVINGISLNSGEVYITTRALKHLYDKKPAEEYDFIIRHLHAITKYPTLIYENKDSKRGGFCLVEKNLKNEDYLCSIEVVDSKIYVATAFRIRDKKYIESYKLLWSWEDDVPPS